MNNWYVKVTEENEEILSKWRDCPVFPGQIVGMVKQVNGNIRKGHSHLGTVKNETFDFGEEITFYQFKQDILGMKTIIGYNLKYLEYKKAALKICDMPNAAYDVWDNNLNSLGYMLGYKSNHHKDLENVGVLDLWFEPVFEEEFKVGDWVVGWHTSYFKDRKTTAWQIGEIYTRDEITYTQVKENSDEVTNIVNLRRATPEEIEAAQSKTFKVGNFEVAVKGGKVFHGEDDITKFVKELIRNNPRATEKQSLEYGGYTATYQDVIFSRTGCQHSESKLSEWLQVYNAL